MIERWGWIGTAVFAVTAIVGGVIAVVAASILFVVGAALMAVAIVIAAQRSREETIEIGLLFFRVPRALVVVLGLQVAIALGTAPFRRSAAFGILVPVFGLGLCGLWGARYGKFPPRET